MKKFLVLLAMSAFLFGGCNFGAPYFHSNNKLYEITDTLTISNSVADIQLDSQILMWPDMAKLKKDIRYAIARNVKEMRININCPGGAVFAMLDIMDQLQKVKNMGIKLSTHAEGVVASAAVPIYLMGEKRTMSERAWIMIHAHSGRSTPYNADSENKMVEEFTYRMAMSIFLNTNMTWQQIMKHCDTNKNQRTDALYLNKGDAELLGFTTE